jgi:hypothetical protein
VVDRARGGDDGLAHLRVFLGDYSGTVTLPDGTQRPIAFTTGPRPATRVVVEP